MLKPAGIEKKISPHQRRHTDATHRLNAGAERVDLQALLGHSTINTTQIDPHVGPERMEQGVGRGWAESKTRRDGTRTRRRGRVPSTPHRDVPASPCQGGSLNRRT